MIILGYKLETFLLNLFFIMFPLIFYPFLYKEKIEARPALKNVLLYFVFMVPVVLCLLFPMIEEDGLKVNLHAVPFIMACLYTNPLVSVLVYLSSMLARLPFGGQGQFLTYSYDTICYLVFLFLLPRYRTFSLPLKMALVFLISFVAKLISKMLFVFFVDANLLNHLLLDFNAIEGVLMALTLYTIESVRRSIQMRKELLDAERLRVASIISASVAHEIRNPLTSVRGFIQLLSGPSPLPPEKRLLYGKISLEEIDRAGRIISDYLSLARPHPEVEEQVDAGEEIRYVGSVLTSFSNLQGIELKVETEEGLYIRGDHNKLRQCIINLSQNGIEAMEDGGVLELSARRRGQQALISISDTGKGMTPEQVQRLGTPYFSTKDKGTGLGTMVSFNIIKNMAGTIEIESKPGEGTSFQISFPLT